MIIETAHRPPSNYYPDLIMSDIGISTPPESKLVLQEPKSAGDRRRAALAEIDEASFSWVHVKACLVAGVGFFTDAYDIFSINIAALAIGMSRRLACWECGS